VFTSYGDFSNITDASFLKSAGKETPVFVRYSTVAGSRGSADTVRDVHGFATRFYTDEGNFGKSICTGNMFYAAILLSLMRSRTISPDYL
jgi:catalase